MIDPKTVPSFKLNDGGVIPCIGMGTFGSDRVTPDEVAGAVAGASAPATGCSIAPPATATRTRSASPATTMCWSPAWARWVWPR